MMRNILSSSSFLYGLCLIFAFVVILSSCKKLDLVRETAVSTDGVVLNPDNTVTASASLIDLGEGSIIDYGNCWSVNALPTINDYKISLGMPSSTGAFTTTTWSLTTGTWYLRAYVIDGSNVLYGEVLSFSITGWACGTMLTDNRDGSTYSTVLIGSQCWMAENLNIGSSINSNAPSDNQTDNSTIEKYCYSNNSATCNDDGGLYQWNEAMNYTTSAQGICPEGWHIPSDNEWKSMEIYLGMTQLSADSSNYRGTDEGTKLKLSGSSGFKAGGTGYRKSDGTYGNLQFGYFWTSTDNGTQAWARGVEDTENGIYRNTISKSYGLCIRCIKD